MFREPTTRTNVRYKVVDISGIKRRAEKSKRRTDIINGIIRRRREEN